MDLKRSEMRWWKYERLEIMAKGSFPDGVETEVASVAAIMLLPTLKRMHYASYSPRTHHPPPQPIL